MRRRCPVKVSKEVFGMYSKGLVDADFHVFEGRGHSLTIDGGRKDVADVALDWFAAKQF
jgi:dipeptidyl aminopeptidase/acylaminoacyl peptidase